MRRVLIGWFLGTGMAPALAGDCAANADSPVAVAPAGSMHAPAPPEQASAADNTERARLEDCPTSTQPAPASSPPAPTGSADYQPQTRFDNTPWRFDMSQNGKRMNADEFSAWMEARGVRVAKGVPGAAAQPAPAVAPEPDKK